MKKNEEKDRRNKKKKDYKEKECMAGKQNNLKGHWHTAMKCLNIQCIWWIQIGKSFNQTKP